MKRGLKLSAMRCALRYASYASRSRVTTFCKVCAFGAIVYLMCYTLLNVQNERNHRTPKIYMWSNLSVESDTCRLPLDIDPYDNSVAEYIVDDGVRRVVCPRENLTQQWTYVDRNGILRFKKALTDINYIKCEYQLYRRYPGYDRSIEYLQKGIIRRDTGISMLSIGGKETNIFVKVDCVNSRDNEKYRNNHFWFNPSMIGNHFANDDSYRPSVLILVIESLSRINYLRHMHLTRQAFESLGNVFYMKGLTKLADNSHPNMVPFLTGHTVDHFGGRYDKGPFDDYPFIWRRFRERGYVTGLMEDDYYITLFNEEEIGRKGFVGSPPTDWYTLPFWRHLMTTDESPLEDFCYYDRTPRVEIFLDQLKHFVRQCNRHSLPYFMFNFYVQVTHVRFNNARIIDSHYAEIFSQLSDALVDNFVILMGDHGSRWGDGFLQTTIGRIEERMPLFGVHIPSRVLESSPHIALNMISNSDKLSTWLDIHQILADIVNNNYSLIENSGHSLAPQSSYSPWRQLIPKNRTCVSALIPQIYCVCDERRKIDTRSQLAVIAALSLVKHINNLLSMPIERCSKLFLREIIRAEQIVVHSSVSSEFVPNMAKLVEVTIVVNPSQAIFRSQIELNGDNHNVIKVDDEITRLNRYANQSFCVNDSLLRKLCFCNIFQIS